MKLMRVYRVLPFHDSSAMFLSWISMLMVFVASLALIGAISLSHVIGLWNRSISGSLTIQISTSLLTGEPRGDDIQKDIDVTLSMLEGTKGVEQAKLLSGEEMNKLMEPWLGDLQNIEDLPIPKLIDVTLSKDKSFDSLSFQTRLAEAVPFAKMDSHRIWLSHLIETAQGIKDMITIVLLLLILTTSFTVVYTTSSSMAVHQDALHLLHIMGARDTMIAIQYATRDFLRSLMGGIIGIIFVFPIVWVVSSLINPLKDPLFEQASLTLSDWYLILSMPVLIALLSFTTAFVTVMKALRKSV